MDWKRILLGGAGIAGAPFTGGASLALTGAAAAGGFGGGKPKAAAAPTATAAPTTGSPSDALSKSATELGERGKALGATGDQALQQVVDYYSKLMSGDAGAIADATQPERARVIDQYDTARKSIAEFGGKGGGTTSASAFSRIAEANELADVAGKARQGAAPALAQIGESQQGLGLSAEQLKSNDLNTLIQKALADRGIDLSEKQLDLTKRGQNLDTIAGLGKAVGDILGLILTRKKAA